jgi:probable HAF family extracellular repeat protein
MLRGNAVVWCALGLLLAGAEVASATAYFTDTGLYNGSSTILSGSIASAYNANGGVIMALGGSDGTNSGAWVWQGNNSTNSSGTGLLTLPSWASGGGPAYGINSNGTIMVGRASAPPGSTVTPFAYTIGSAYNSAANLGAYDANPATGASNSGVVVFADAQYLLPGGTQAFPLPGGSGQQTLGKSTMSADGTIAGVTASDGGLPEIWTPVITGGVITGYNSPIVFGTVASPFAGGGAPGVAMNVNDAANAVGSYMFWGSGNQKSAPALFIGNGGSNPSVFPISPYTTLTPNSDSGQANAINSNGTVVGWDTFGNQYGTGATSAHAFVWTPNTANGTTGTFRDLNTLYASILPTDVVLNDAVGINNRGDILCIASGGTLHAREFVLITQSATLPGDANGDNKVDVNDLTIVLTNYNKTAGMNTGTGDFNSDAKVDVNDLTIVLTNYNQSLGSSAGGGLSAVPEPGAMALLAAAFAGLLGFAGRWRRIMM